MIRALSALLICGLLVPAFFAGSAQGANAMPVTEEPLPAGSKISITSYDEVSETYVITPTEFPGEGDGTVTPQALTKAIKSLNLQALTEDPLSVVGKSYECDAPLDLLSWKG